MLTAEAQYSVKFSISNEKFCFSLHYNRSNSFLFVYATKMYQFKAKDSETRKYTLCLRNISRDFSAKEMKKKTKKQKKVGVCATFLLIIELLILINNIINIH